MNSEDLFKAAMSIRDNSHSPYSQYKVASAVLMDDGNIYAGINVKTLAMALQYALNAQLFALLSVPVPKKLNPS